MEEIVCPGPHFYRNMEAPSFMRLLTKILSHSELVWHFLHIYKQK